MSAGTIIVCCMVGETRPVTCGPSVRMSIPPILNAPSPPTERFQGMRDRNSTVLLLRLTGRFRPPLIDGDWLHAAAFGSQLDACALAQAVI